MNETIKLMKSHVSVRSFTGEKIADSDLQMILEAAQMASSWKNFQSYSIVKVRNQATKQAIYALQNQPWILNCDTFLVLVGDLHRAKKATQLHTDEFYPEGVENLLISAVDVALVGQNLLLAAESLGYGGVMIGMIRQSADELAQLLKLPDYTYPVFGIALGVPKKRNEVKPRLPLSSVVFDEVYQPQAQDVIQDYDKVQSEYAGSRKTSLWSERVAAQFGQKESPVTKRHLKDKKLLT